MSEIRGLAQRNGASRPPLDTDSGIAWDGAVSDGPRFFDQHRLEKEHVHLGLLKTAIRIV